MLVLPTDADLRPAKRKTDVHIPVESAAILILADAVRHPCTGQRLFRSSAADCRVVCFARLRTSTQLHHGHHQIIRFGTIEGQDRRRRRPVRTLPAYTTTGPPRPYTCIHHQWEPLMKWNCVIRHRMAPVCLLSPCWQSASTC